MTAPSVVTMLRFEYQAVASFAVASPDPGGALDLPISTDVDGAPWIPPSTIAGSLRSHLRSVMDASTLTEIMGSEPQEMEDGTSRISRLRINGTVLSRVKKTARMQTAIDRNTGSARAGSLRSVEAVDAGALLTVYMTVDGTLSDSERMALAGWRPMLGRSRSVGMGLFEPVNLRVGSLDLATGEHMEQWLARGGPDLHDTVATHNLDVEGVVAATTMLRVRVRVVDGLFSFESSAGNVATSRTTVPGSTLKGVFRSRLEYILRSVGLEACQDSRCGGCTACRVFGYANSTGAQRSRVTFRDAPVFLDGDRLGLHRMESRTHVAIDRVTGGASRSRLFVERVVPPGATFDIEIDALGDTSEPWIAELLLWVVKDLEDGYIGVGGRTTRGFGTVRIVDVVDRQGYVQAAVMESLRPVRSIVEERVNIDA